jgi:hypothetical protein
VARTIFQNSRGAIDSGPPLAVATLLEKQGRELAFAGRMVVRPDGNGVRFDWRCRSRAYRRARSSATVAARHASCDAARRHPRL